MRPTLDLQVIATDENIAAGASVWLEAALPGDQGLPYQNGFLSLPNAGTSSPSFSLELPSGLRAKVRPYKSQNPEQSLSRYDAYTWAFSLTDPDGNYGFGLSRVNMERTCGRFCDASANVTLDFYDPSEPQPNASNYLYRLTVATRGCSTPLEDAFGFKAGDTFTLEIAGFGGCGCYRGKLAQPCFGINGTICLEFVGGNKFINRGATGVDWPEPDNSIGAVIVHYFPRLNMPSGQVGNQVLVVEFQLPTLNSTLSDDTLGASGTFGFFLSGDCNLLDATNYADVLEQPPDEREPIEFKEVYWTAAEAEIEQYTDSFGWPTAEVACDATKASMFLRKQECTLPTRNITQPYYWAFTPVGRTSAEFPPPQTATVDITLANPDELLLMKGESGEQVTIGEAFGGLWTLDLGKNWTPTSYGQSENEPIDNRQNLSEFSGYRLFGRNPSRLWYEYDYMASSTLLLQMVRFAPDYEDYLGFEQTLYPPEQHPDNWGLVLTASSTRVDNLGFGAQAYLMANFPRFPETFVFDGTYNIAGKFLAVRVGPAATQPQDATAVVTINHGLP